MAIFKKTNYFYIDESGGILNDSPSFILGCCRTDIPEIIFDRISGLLQDFEDEIYYSPMIEKIKQQGFHAVDNHPDVRADFFALLPTLSFRSFFCIINKAKSPFRELIRDKKEEEVYVLALDQLLKGRLNNKSDKNIFIFEELQFKNKSQQQILDEYFKPHLDIGDVEYKICGKEEVNLAIVDYMNYIFHSLLSTLDLKKVQRMVDNFELVKDKIAFINILHSKTFFSRKKTFTLEDVIKKYSG